MLPVYGSGKVERLNKAYIVLYTCAATRAIILDVVNSANTKSLVRSLRRFIARRGTPARLISDNGSSFVAGETQNFATNRMIEWKFNIPLSPWMGGMWERLVSCVKKCLKRTIGVKQVSFVELQTLVLEVEAVLNNRPICRDYDDELEEVLSPNHLVFGRRLESMNCVKAANSEIDNSTGADLSKRDKHLNGMRNHFWDVWRKEYLVTLRENHKSSTMQPEVVKENDIVVVHDKFQPRHLWKLGRIEELIRSNDGLVRAAKVVLGSSGNSIKRPIKSLYPIETRTHEKSEEIRPKRKAAVVGENKRRSNSNHTKTVTMGGV